MGQLWSRNPEEVNNTCGETCTQDRNVKNMDKSTIFCTHDIIAKTLPTEIITLILGYLSGECILKSRMVCKTWNDIIIYNKKYQKSIGMKVSGISYFVLPRMFSFVPKPILNHSLTSVTKLSLCNMSFYWNCMDQEDQISFFSRLTYLSLQNCNIYPSAVESILLACDNLQTLCLTRLKSAFTSSFLSDEHVREKMKITLNKVTQLDLSSNRSLTSLHLRLIISCLVNLNSINLMNTIFSWRHRLFQSDTDKLTSIKLSLQYHIEFNIFRYLTDEIYKDVLEGRIRHVNHRILSYDWLEVAEKNKLMNLTVGWWSINDECTGIQEERYLDSIKMTNVWEDMHCKLSNIFLEQLHCIEHDTRQRLPKRPGDMPNDIEKIPNRFKRFYHPVYILHK